MGKETATGQPTQPKDESILIPACSAIPFTLESGAFPNSRGEGVSYVGGERWSWGVPEKRTLR